VNALGFGLGEEFAEGAQGFRVRMANGDGLAFFASIFDGKLQLAANSADFLNIIEKGNVAEGAGDSGGLGCVVGYRCGGGAAVDEE